MQEVVGKIREQELARAERAEELIFWNNQNTRTRMNKIVINQMLYQIHRKINPSAI